MGLNTGERTSEGEFSDEVNLTTDYFPTLAVKDDRKGTTSRYIMPTDNVTEFIWEGGSNTPIIVTEDTKIELLGTFKSDTSRETKQAIETGSYLSLYPADMHINLNDLSVKETGNVYRIEKERNFRYSNYYYLQFAPFIYSSTGYKPMSSLAYLPGYTTEWYGFDEATGEYYKYANTNPVWQIKDGVIYHVGKYYSQTKRGQSINKRGEELTEYASAHLGFKVSGSGTSYIYDYIKAVYGLLSPTEIMALSITDPYFSGLTDITVSGGFTLGLSGWNGRHYRDGITEDGWWVFAAGEGHFPDCDYIGGAYESDFQAWGWNYTGYFYISDSELVPSPQFDFVTTYANRVWGCYSGLNKYTEEKINEIYASYLGEPWNWNTFNAAASVNSYVASRGSIGDWTGAITYADHPLFFKEDIVDKVFVSNTGAHQIITQDIKGVKKGCSRSLAIVEGYLYYYNSNNEFVRYDGTDTTCISEGINDIKLNEVSASVCKHKYYACGTDQNGNRITLVYDTRKQIWHKENISFKFAAGKSDGMAYIADADAAGRLPIIYACEDCPKTGYYQEINKESDFFDDTWSATFGAFGFEYPDNKYLSRFVVRADMPKDSYYDIYTRYDDREWIYGGTIQYEGLKSVTLPVKPRRCDHMELKLEGKGQVKVYSVARILERGSDKY